MGSTLLFWWIAGPLEMELSDRFDSLWKLCCWVIVNQMDLIKTGIVNEEDIFSCEFLIKRQTPEIDLVYKTTDGVKDHKITKYAKPWIFWMFHCNKIPGWQDAASFETLLSILVYQFKLCCVIDFPPTYILSITFILVSFFLWQNSFKSGITAIQLIRQPGSLRILFLRKKMLVELVFMLI